MPTFGSLFSGIGGFDLGLERAGWECAWQVEIDPFCREVLESHWPGLPRPMDVRSVSRRDLSPVDLICGGFPCQPVSVAGRRRAQQDERWLWPEFIRVIRLLRPRLVLVENVPGLLAHGMGDVLGDLAGCGFDAEWDSLPAAAFGAPHLRDRVFIVAWAQHGRPVADSGSGRGPTDDVRPGRNAAGSSGQAMANPYREPALWASIQRSERHPWSVEPDVGRVAHGVPRRVDRLRALGNAIVPQVAEYLGAQLLAFISSAHLQETP